MRYQLAASLALALAVLAPAGAVVDRYVVASEPLTKPNLRKFHNGPFVVVAQAVGERGNQELFIALSLHPRNGWRVTRLPLPPSQRLGDAFDAVVASPEAQRVFYMGIIANPHRDMPIWRWDGGESWTLGQSIGPASEATNRCVNSVAVAHSSGELLYAAGWEIVPPGRLVAQIWRSTDAGLTWRSLCRDGALLPALGAVTTTETVGPQAELGVPAGGVFAPSQAWARVAYLDATVLGLNGSGTIWGRFGERALKIEPDRPIYLSPPFEGCVSLQRVSAPLPLAVWAYWWKDAVLSPRRFLSYTGTNGERWGHQSLEPKAFWAIPAVGECLVDFADLRSGCVAAQVADGAGGKAWSLYWRTSKQRPVDPWQVEKLPGVHVLDLDASWEGEAFMLARGPDPNELYCLHWQAARPKVNRPPSQPTLSIVPAKPKTTDNVRCVATGSVDPDGDKVTYIFAWARQNTPGAPRSHNTATLPAQLTAPGEAWVCVVKPTDGKEIGPAATIHVDIAR